MDADDLPATRRDEDITLHIVSLDDGTTVVFTRGENGYPVEDEAMVWDGPVYDLDGHDNQVME